ncbi:hypothetical protein B0T22DRAFT_477383 [Podospora appendiculata]|uniref:Uncharacterized protein n=1 Tax=Podospora appendiculata TaxID=314037 RepID=A0AAE1CHE8_9PEZI|nr:hypothetical protein B0T22DRAFT_477383 [Podospora appendiculata]
MSNALVKNVYFVQPEGVMVEHQSPFKDQIGVWGNDNFSGLYTASNLSSLSSYWYQDFGTRVQILANFFQELGANSLTVARYAEEAEIGEPWQSTRQSLSIQDGSPIASAPAGDGRDLRLYVAGTDGNMKQYPFNIESASLGSPVSELHPFSAVILIPVEHSLTLVSCNCSGGFLMQQDRIKALLKPSRTYLGLSATAQTSSLSFTDQRVHVLYDEDNGPAVEEWQIPTSGGRKTTGQNGPLKLIGKVAINPS